MNVLILCSRIPFPLHDGGNLAVHNIFEGLLQAGVRTSMLAMNTSRHWVAPDSLPEIFSRLQQLVTVPVDNRIKPVAALVSLLEGSSYNLKRFISKDYEQALIALLQSDTFDVIILEGLFVTPYTSVIRKYSNAKICYRQHNIEFEIWERLAQDESNIVKRWYLQRLAAALRKYESETLNNYDSVAAISPIDAGRYQAMGCHLPIVNIPFGVQVEQLDEGAVAFEAPLQFYHIGAMDWQPNVDAMIWLLNEVWPQVMKQIPNACLHLAGRRMPEMFFKHHWPGVKVYGEVEDAAAFESDKHILLVPLHSGGGLRIKVLHAMARAKAVIATTIGMQGLEEAVDGRHFIRADEAVSFADACVKLYNNVSLAQHMAEQARQLVASHYSQREIIKDLIGHLQQLGRQ